MKIQITRESITTTGFSAGNVAIQIPMMNHFQQNYDKKHMTMKPQNTPITILNLTLAVNAELQALPNLKVHQEPEEADAVYSPLVSSDDPEADLEPCYPELPDPDEDTADESWNSPLSELPDPDEDTSDDPGEDDVDKYNEVVVGIEPGGGLIWG